MNNRERIKENIQEIFDDNEGADSQFDIERVIEQITDYIITGKRLDNLEWCIACQDYHEPIKGFICPIAINKLEKNNA